MNKKEVYKLIKDKGFVTLYRIVKDKKVTMAHYLLEKNEIETVHIEFYNNNTKMLINGLEDKYYGASTLNGRTQLSGETNADHSQQSIIEKATNKFLEEYMKTKKEERKVNMRDFISGERHYQHNVENGIGDGIEETIESTMKSDLFYDKTLIKIIEGNFLDMMNEQYWLNPKSEKVETWKLADIIRFHDGMCIEHWDIIRRKI